MTSYSIEPKTRKYVNGYGFLSFARNPSDKYGKTSNTATKRRLDAAKTASKKEVHQTPETTEYLI